MKKFMLFLCLLLLIGCSGNDLQEKEYGEEEVFEKPILIIIDNDIILKQLDLVHATFNGQELIPYKFMPEWKSYIKSTFGVDLNIDFLTFKQVQNLNASLKEMKGIALVDDLNSIRDLIDSNIIVPLNEYIKDMKILNTIDQVHVNKNMDASGNIWAIPGGISEFCTVRAYDKRHIDESLTIVPINIDMFYEYALGISKHGNNTYALMINKDFANYHLTDIHRAFGCYSNNDYSIAFNPLTETFENYFFNEDALEMLYYLKSLADNDCIVLAPNRPFEMGKHTVTTRMEPIFIVDEENYYYGYGLSGVNSKKLIKRELDRSVYVLLNNTIDKTTQLNIFIKDFLFTVEGNLALFYGIPGSDYLWHDDKNVIVNTIEDIYIHNQDQNVPLMYTCSVALDINNIKSHIAEYNEKNVLRNSYLEEYKNMKKLSDDFYFLSIDHYMPKSLMDTRVNDLTSLLYEKLVTDKSISGKDLLEEYRREFIKIGGLELIVKANNSIDKISVYNYN